MDILEGTVSNLDTMYLIHNVGAPLKKALAEITQKRPQDPIGYLSDWLKNYKYYNSEQIKKKERLETMMMAEAEKEMKLACIGEEKCLSAQKRKDLFEQKLRVKRAEQEEEKKRLELEKFLKAPEEKNELGLTALHRRAAEQDADLTYLNRMPHLLANRDLKFRTPRDVAQQMGWEENVTAIDNFVFSLFEKGKIKVLQYLLLNSYEHFEQTLDLIPDGQVLPEASEEFIATITDMQEKILRFFSSIQTGEEEETAKLLDYHPELATCKNQRGESPLHVAILCDNFPAVKHILLADKEAVHITDNSNRTPLHYAYALSELITEYLSHYRAKTDAMDLSNYNPIDYQAIPTEIVKLKKYYKSGTSDPS